MISWSEWKQKNKVKLAHPAGFEEKFVDLVLSKIPELSPNDVTPQYHFTDSKGNRYIDFMIINTSKGWYLPIELDGKWKTETYHDLNDMLERQNVLIQKFGILLRYTNKKMFNESVSIISEITNTLSNQSSGKSNITIRDEHIRRIMEEYEARLKAANQTMSTQTQDFTSTLQDVQQALAAMGKQMETRYQPLEVGKPEVVNSSNTKHGYYALAFVAVAVVIGSTVILSNRTNSAQGVQVSTLAKVEPLTLSSANLETATTPVPNSVDTKPLRTISVVPEVHESPVKTAQPVVSPEPEPVSIEQPTYTIGSNQEVCGDVAQYKEFNKGVYLNLGHAYPNQDITIVVWNASSSDVSGLVHTNVCASGVITEYKGKPQVAVQSISSIISQ